MNNIKKGNFYLHNQNGEYQHVNKRTIESAIKIAKTYCYPIQVSQLIKDITPYFELKYAHIPDLNKFHSGNQMTTSMIRHNIKPNII